MNGLLGSIQYHSHRRGENVEQFAVWNVDEPEEARNNVKIPEEIGIDSDIFEEKGEKSPLIKEILKGIRQK